MSNFKTSRMLLGARIIKLIQRIKSVQLRQVHARRQEMARHQAQERLQTFGTQYLIPTTVPPEQR
jgi:hypothetical protein